MAVETLINELAADLDGYYTNRTFPREVGLAEAAEVAGFLQDQAEMGIDARAAGIKAAGVEIACKKGCNVCCEQPIMVFRPEAARVAQWLARPENAETRAAFLEAYAVWKEQVGEMSEKLSVMFLMDPDNYVAYNTEVWKKRVMCAFNRDGACTVYPVRPTACREGHALETADHCSVESTTKPTRATFVPLDQFLAKSRRLLTATHNAMVGDRWRPESLPHLVYAMLGELESRNTVP